MQGQIASYFLKKLLVGAFARLVFVAIDIKPTLYPDGVGALAPTANVESSNKLQILPIRPRQDKKAHRSLN